MRIPLMLTTAVLVAASAPPAATSAAAETAPTQVVPAPLKIVALGDSLTSGHRLPRNEAYPAHLEEMFREARLPHAVVNHGVSGDTTAGGVRRLDRALDENPDVLIVALGANDGLRGVPVTQVRTNLTRIIEAAQARGVAVLLCGMEALPLFGWQYTLDFHRVYTDLAVHYDVPLVPFLLSGVIGNPDLMTQDGIHPNAAGARAMAATIWPHLHRLVTTLRPAQLAAHSGPSVSRTRRSA